MATLASLIVSLMLDSAKFNQELEQSAGKLEQLGGRMQSVGTSMAKTGGMLTAGVTLPIVALGAVAVNSASDLEESANAVNVVFGEAAQTLHDWGTTASTSIGLTQADFNQLGAQTGALLTNLGLDQAQAADETIALSQRAADMASIFNTDVTESLFAIQAGLRGETEPLRRFGVMLSDAAVTAKALEMGLGDATGAVDGNAKAAAALELIYEQTDKLAGDFQNTSDGVANAQRIVKAQVTDLAASFGKELLPLVQQGIAFFRDLLDRFTALDPKTRKIILLVAGIAAVVGPVLVVVGGLIAAIGTVISVATAVAGVISGPVLLAIAAVIGIIALLAAAWAGNWGGIRDTVMQIWEGTIKPALGQLIAWLQVTIPQVLQFLANLWTTTLLPAIQAVGNFIASVLIPILGAIIQIIGAVLGAVLTAAAAFWQNVLLPAIQAVWGFISGSVIPLFAALADVVSAVLGVALTALAGLWQNVLQPALETVWSFIQANVIPVLSAVADAISNVLGPPLDWLANTMLAGLQATFEGVSDAIAKVVDWLKELAAKLKVLELPDFLTTGSPTPFETGLVGIGNALRDLNRTQLPQLSANLAFDGAGPGAGLGAGGLGIGEIRVEVYPSPGMDEEMLARKTAQRIMEATRRAIASGQGLGGSG